MSGSALDAGAVRELFAKCHCTNPRGPDGHTMLAETKEVEGIMSAYIFWNHELEAHRKTIIDWLNQLPSSFHKNGGGGMSFLNACMTEDGNQWGDHPDMEALFCLGMGIGCVECPIPRSAWSALPGGMPYYIVDTTEVER